MKYEGLEKLEDLEFKRITDKKGLILNLVLNYSCSKCHRRLNLREGYIFYPQEKIILCQRCERKRTKVFRELHKNEPPTRTMNRHMEHYPVPDDGYNQKPIFSKMTAIDIALSAD